MVGHFKIVYNILELVKSYVEKGYSCKVFALKGLR